MIPTIKPSDCAIITLDKIVKSFDKTPCYLLRRTEFLRENAGAGSRTYKVRTDLVHYVEQEEYEDNEAGEGMIVMKQCLKVKEVRQPWSESTFTNAQIDALSLAVKELLPVDLPRSQHDREELKQALLLLTKQQKAWDISEDQWRILTAEDIVIDIE